MIRRQRRLRVNSAIRNMVHEVSVDKSDLIYPVFVIDGETEDVPSMPGIRRHSLADLPKELERAVSAGVGAVIFFGIPKNEDKDEVGSGAYDDNGIAQRAIRLAKRLYPNLIIIADICLCEYTSHGHCGIVEGDCILNDETLPLLSSAALSCARAGADMIAPSDMMDGRVAAIRTALDAEGFINTLIMSYSVKYSSAYYGPFRDAASSAPAFGDRKTYQMDYRNRREAMTEARMDIEEGADIIMVKPAMAYLDIVRDAANRFEAPIAAYHVSGEYAMLKAAAQNGWLSEKQAVIEALTAIKRAGAKLIITYYAVEAAEWIGEK